VIGAIYGDCRPDSVTAAPKVTKVEAIVVELLARGVATGLARMEQERAALTARVQFEQFFTPQLAQQLAREPDLLEGRDAEVSLLVCAIRGFSRISERLGPEGTVRWISQVMEALSECVLRHAGVLVDYIGDQLMAMWGAPVVQYDHAQMACQAALDMLDALPALNERWQGVLGGPLSIGIGINTGIARVGNTGSRFKFKYGPLGNTVNLANRVRILTKHLRAPLLLTRHTRERLAPAMQERARRLCMVRGTNRRPLDLYDLARPNQPAWPEWKEVYEEALSQFEEARFRQAARTLQPLVTEQLNDGPSLVLLSRAVQGQIHGPTPGHPVWRPLRK
jgi:adenylate cyclase